MQLSDPDCTEPEHAVTIENIVRSCFSNPDRLKFPDFPRDVASVDYMDICHEFESAEDFLSLVKKLIPSLIQHFDSLGITLDD